jgi:serine/threonine protein kinase
MHQKGICHRDLNPSNVMVDKFFRIKIIDFSASKLFKIFNEINPMITPIGTPAYKAPEIFTAASYGEKVDMWAAGIILFEAIFNRKPFSKETYFLSDFFLFNPF